MNKRALITGAGGFVGQHLFRYLSQCGWDVFGCDIHPQKNIIQCDVQDEQQVKTLLNTLPPLTHVFYLSAITFVPQSVQDPSNCFKVNTDSVVVFTDILRKYFGENVKFIFISTSEVYGPPVFLPIDETHPLNPQNPYAISKLSSDLYCQYLARHGLLSTIVVRPFNHSGAGQNERFVLSNFAKQFAEMQIGLKDPVLYVGNIEVERDFLHVDDVVCAYEMLANCGEEGEVYNLCSGISVALSTVIDILQELTNLKIEVVVENTRRRKHDIKKIYGSSQKIKRNIGWSPKKDINNILIDLLAFWKDKLANAS
ncbi:MAG TPA: GDP-mannose 4,6-dehydratase [Candidatus Hydrogenedens sp.]|nr:GDP-mannose 4,6-dehydratase [Candidatus Hydrogenedens sp.]HOL19098.1 GDP-mannose 4,6-dehydratase [Candidatus Hydrogenedens sp.]HPP58084.1 GDP-mannose 4,6-dehydratase [Candidatus Hydrogenedens sp.]